MAKKIYIAGKIAGDSGYQVKFMKARAQLMKQGDVVMTPGVLPEGMLPGDYMKVRLAMIDVADAVAFLPDYTQSQGAMLELSYCRYIGKEILFPWGCE